MNSSKALKNSIISVCGQVLTLVLQFINRRIFVLFLDIEYLGYQSVFGNVFSLLSVAELGISGIISFHLYREIVTGNEEEIGKLMYMYKWVYRIIAIVVAILGIVASVFVPYIVKDGNSDIHYLYIIYFMQLACTVSGYFLSYRRTLYAADQKEYKTVEIDLGTNIVVQFFQLALLVLFHDYLLYLSVQLSIPLISNIIILYRSNLEYPFLKKKYIVSIEDIRKRNIVSDIKNLLVHKIAYAVYSGTDNIVISSICGIRDVALYGNYFLLQKGVMNVLFYRLLNPIQASLGNIVYSNRKKVELWNQFEMFEVFSFFFASYISIGFLIFFQPAIQIWMGSVEYLLPFSFVVAYSLSIYLQSVWEIVYKYRSVFGDYRQDRNCMLLSAVLNVVLSVILAKPFGVTGVQIGSFFAYLPVAYGRVRFVVRNYFGKPLKRYFAKHLLQLVILIAEGLVVYLLTKNLPISFAGLLLRTIAWAIIPFAVNIIIYFRNPHFKEMCVYFGQFVQMIAFKLKQHGAR